MDSPLIRPARPSDQAFVASTWAFTLCDGGEHCGGNHRRADDPQRTRSCNTSRNIVDRMLDHSSVRIIIAAQPTDSDRIIGWLAYSPAARARLLHMVYVREHERRQGIAEMLVEKAWPSQEIPWSTHQGSGPGNCRCEDCYRAMVFIYTVIGPHAPALLSRFTNAVHLPVMEFLS